jgi:hypothetical protein
MRRRTWLISAAVLGAVWWGSLWLQLDRSILVRVPILDEAYYLRAGHQIAQGRLVPPQPFVMSPLYPYLVAATGAGRAIDERNVRVGPPPLGLWLLQAGMWLAIPVMLFRVGRRWLPRWAALLSALLFLLYRPAAIFAVTTLLEIPLTFLITVTLYHASRPSSTTATADGRRRGRVVLVGLLVGLAALLRAHAVLLLLPLGFALIGARRLRDWALFIAVCAAVILPAVIHNSLAGGRLAGISCNGGLNLYIGNGPEADGFYVSFAGFDFEEDPAGVAFLSARLARPVAGVAEADRIWAQAALATIKERPVRTLGLWFKKVWLHFVDWEIPQVTPLEAWPRDGWLLRPLVLPYGLLAVVGLLGLLVTAWWREGVLRPWAIALLVLIAAQSLFFVVTRYRLVLVPMLCLLGSAGIARLVSCRRRRLAGIVVGLAAAVLLTRPWGLATVQVHWQALGYCNEAVRWEWVGDAESLPRAEALYRKALTTDPTQMVAYRNLARVLVRQDRFDAAEDVLGRGILRAARTEFIEKDLISLLLQQDRVAAALPRLSAFLRDHPEDPEVLHNYVVALTRTGRIEAALAGARRLVSSAPDSPQGYIDLGVLLARAGRLQEARDVLRAGLLRNPGQTDLRQNLERLSEKAGAADSSASALD